jgi:hypothetical protein
VHQLLSIQDYKNKDALHDCIDDVTAAIEAIEASRDGVITLLELTAIDYLHIVRKRLTSLVEKE